MIFLSELFYDKARTLLFGGKLLSSQKTGMEDIINDFFDLGYQDKRHLAYILATVYHETGKKMLPVREGFALTDEGARKKVAHYKYGTPDPITGHVYYGRGFVQITWKENYKKLGDLLGIDLVNNPDLALNCDHAVSILLEGMYKGASKRGDFTGKSLENYFNETTDDPVGARKIINGNDRAGLIAGYHYHFLRCLDATLYRK